MSEKVEFVSRFYEMDPRLETLLRGADLQNGMEVILETAEYRQDLAELDLTYKFLMEYKARPQTDELSLIHMDQLERTHGIRKERALRWNRWMIISDLQFIGTRVSFIGTYADGTQKFASIYATEAWYVKKASIKVAERLAEGHDCRVGGCLQFPRV